MPAVVAMTVVLLLALMMLTILIVASQAHLNGPLRTELTQNVQDRLQAAGPVPAAIKIESGAKSTLDPNSDMPIKPYVDADLPA